MPACQRRLLLPSALLLGLAACAASAGAEPLAPTQGLAATSAEIAQPQRWRGDGAAPRSSLEVDARQPVAGSTPWSNSSSMNVRMVRWGPAAAGGSVGLSMGVGAQQQASQPLYGPAPAAGLAPEVGVRWRSGWSGDHRVDVGAYGSYDTNPATPAAERRSVNARVELQFRDRHAPLGFDTHGALGMNLSGNSQVMLRSRHGGPMLYYRSQW